MTEPSLAEARARGSAEMNDIGFNSNILGRKAARLVCRGGVPLLVVGLAAGLVACGGGDSGGDVARTSVATATSTTGSVTPTGGYTTPVSVSTGTSASAKAHSRF